MEKTPEITPEPNPNQNANLNPEEMDAEKAADYANYFVAYASVFHQKIMLMDRVRTVAYRDSMLKNRHLFKGKVVMDCGSGTGILSMFAAQAGAKKVYAIEYTDMAKQSRKLINANGFGDTIEVIQSSMEDVTLPCKVDIIVSEWMGYMLFRESMLDSVLKCRDKWMKPGGSMFPSHATMYFAAINNEDERKHTKRRHLREMDEVKEFQAEMSGLYNVDFSCLDGVLQKEIDEFHYAAQWCTLDARCVVGEPQVVKQLNLNTCTMEDVQGVSPTNFIIPLPSARLPTVHTVSGFAGWFTADFFGSVENPARTRITLSTAPKMGYQHWGQQAFYFSDALRLRVTPEKNNVDAKSVSSNVKTGNDRVSNEGMLTMNQLAGSVEMTRHPTSKRLYRLHITCYLNRDRNAQQDSDDSNPKYVFDIL